MKQTIDEINIHVQSSEKTKNGYDITIENVKFQKMLFLFNAINDGWRVKKDKDSYIFTKNHEDKKEIFTETYLYSFMEKNFDMNKLLK